MTINTNTITKNFDLMEVTVNSIVATAKTLEMTCPIDDCKGEIDVFVDNSASESADVTLTVYGGVSPIAMADTDYEIAAGKEGHISVSTAETMQQNGTLKMKLTSESSLALHGLRVIVFKRRYVTNY